MHTLYAHYGRVSTHFICSWWPEPATVLAPHRCSFSETLFYSQGEWETEQILVMVSLNAQPKKTANLFTRHEMAMSTWNIFTQWLLKGIIEIHIYFSGGTVQWCNSLPQSQGLSPSPPRCPAPPPWRAGQLLPSTSGAQVKTGQRRTE